MPTVKEHCRISKNRCDYDYEDLHKWMDEPQQYFGMDHRLERHTLHDIYMKYVMEKWGKQGVLEFINHIIEDYKQTAEKIDKKYNKEDQQAFNQLMKESDPKLVNQMHRLLEKVKNSDKTNIGYVIDPETDEIIEISEKDKEKYFPKEQPRRFSDNI